MVVLVRGMWDVINRFVVFHLLHGVYRVSAGLWKTSDLCPWGLASPIPTFCWCHTVIINTVFILKIKWMLYIVSIPDSLFHTICSVLNCCVALQHLAKIEAPLLFPCRDVPHLVDFRDQSHLCSGTPQIYHLWCQHLPQTITWIYFFF